MSVIVCLTRCYPCMFGQCPGGWHTWADSEDVLHGFITRQVDVRHQKCGCSCTDGPELAEEPPDMPPAELIHLDEPCAVCGAPGACAWDVEGKPLIHAGADESECES